MKSIISVIVFLVAGYFCYKWFTQNQVGDYVPEGPEYLMEADADAMGDGPVEMKIKKDGQEVASWTSECSYAIRSQDPQAFQYVFDNIFLKESCLLRTGEKLTGTIVCRNFNGANAIGFGVKDNVLNGTFKVVAPGDRVVFKCSYKEGKLDGPFIASDITGGCTLAYGSFKDGKLDGKFHRNICHTTIGDVEPDVDRVYENGKIIKETDLKIKK